MRAEGRRTDLEATAGEPSVLLLSPPPNPVDVGECWRHLDRRLPAGANVLLVRYADAAGTPIHEWYDPEVQDTTVLIRVGRQAPSRGAPGEGGGVADRVETRDDPADVTGLFLLADRCFHKWSGGDAPVALVFVSLTAMLAHVDLETALRTIGVLRERLAELGATGYFHASTAHDAETLSLLSDAVDAVVEFDGDRRAPR